MEKIFQIGGFTFRLSYPAQITPPPNFLLFEAPELTAESVEYDYEIEISEILPLPAGRVLARRPDLVVLANEAPESYQPLEKYQTSEYRRLSEDYLPQENRPALESRLIGVKGTEGYYACYQETAPDRARVTLARDRIQGLSIDPVFTSLLALERRLVQRDSLILHCAYMEYHGQAILFSAPSETGKTTQATLWETYRGGRTVNGDRALLAKKDGRWCAQGWPVCGTSEICSNEVFPIQAVVMLSQDRENHAKRLTPGQAFPLLYSQITVNRWNMDDHLRAMDQMERLLADVQVFHLGCTISEEAVACLESALKNI